MSPAARSFRPKPRWILAGLLGLVVLAALGWLSAPGTPYKLLDRLAHYDGKVRERLRAEGWRVLADLEDVAPRDGVTGTLLEVVGCRLTKGRFDRGRRFDGSEEHHIAFPLRWTDLQEAFTLALWIQPEASPAVQCVLGLAGTDLQHGLFLEDGSVQAHFGTPDGEHIALRHPLPEEDRWIHLGLVYDAADGQATLYLDGQPVATETCGAIRVVPWQVELGKNDKVRIDHPYRGRMDDVVIAQRAFTPERMARLASMPAREVAVGDDADARKRGQIERVLAISARLAATRARLFGHIPSGNEDALPLVKITCSKKLHTDLIEQQAKAIQRGQIPGDLLDLEEGAWRREGETHAMRWSPFYPDASWIVPDQPALVVQPQAPEGARSPDPVVLVPFQAIDWQNLLLGTRLARDAGLYEGPLPRPCRLTVNQTELGAYLEIPYSLVVRSDLRWLHQAPRVNRLAGQSRDALAELLRELADPLRASAARKPEEHGLRPTVWYRDGFAGHQLVKEAAQVLHEPPRHRLALGLQDWGPRRVLGADQPASGIVLRDLLLPQKGPGSLTLAYQSSDPDVLDHQGRIVTPSSNRFPTLTEVATFEGAALTNRFSLYVPPQPLTLPLFELNTADAFYNTRRVYAEFTVWPPHTEAPMAAQRRVAAVKFRGNSKLHRPKKSYSIDLGTRHAFFQTGEPKHLYFNVFDGDLTHIRDKLAMALLERIHGSWPTHYPEIESAVLSVNKHRSGLYQLSERVSRDLLEWPRKPDKKRPGVLIKSRNLQFDPDIALEWDVKYPGGSEAADTPWLEPLYRVATGDREVFARDIGRHLDLESFLSYHLLLWLSGNPDGNANNYFLFSTRGKKGELAPWQVIPWDFDHGFASPKIHTNHLINRLIRDHAPYRRLLISRWRDLREGPLTEPATLAMADELALRLAPYTPLDDHTWRKPSGEQAQEVVRMKQWLSQRLDLLDRVMNDIEQRGEFVLPPPSRP